MRIPYGFILASDGVLNINKDEADVISMIFDFYIAGASLGKIVDMLYAKQILQVEIPQLTFVASRVKLVIYNIARKGVVVCRLGESFDESTRT